MCRQYSPDGCSFPGPRPCPLRTHRKPTRLRARRPRIQSGHSGSNGRGFGLAIGYQSQAESEASLKNMLNVTSLTVCNVCSKTLDDLKMEELVEQKKVVKKPDPVKKKIDREKVSFVEKRNLLNELENLAKIDSINKKDERESLAKVVVEEKPNKVYESVLKKLESISVVSSRVAVEIADPKLDKSKYQSKLRTLPDTPRKTEIPSDDNSFVFSEREGNPGADVQSLYALLIREKIYKNWRDPLAEQHSKEAIISFHIFPKGNIDKPFIKQSSGVEVLDTLAVRAVMDSVPFPKFPKELTKSNLLLSICLLYTSDAADE